MKILIYGYGNPGRQDDGLGNAFVEILEKWVKDNQIKNIEFDSNYQLNIEDAATIADKDLVIFADASCENIESFVITPVKPKQETSFTSHSASPEYILYLCNDIYKRIPSTFIVHIKGYEWDFKESLTDKAAENLMKAVDAIKKLLADPGKIINFPGDC